MNSASTHPVENSHRCSSKVLMGRPWCALQLEAVKLTRKNGDIKPFEAGGEGTLEHLARRSDAALFAMGSSTKKRPNNLTLGESEVSPET